MISIDRAILQQLDQVAPLLLPEATLLDGVNLALPEPVTLTTLRAKLVVLEARREAVSVQSEDRGTRWRITDQGIARLRC